MKLIVKPSRLAGEIAVIGSKSHTIRGIAAALMANGTSVLHAPLDSADTRSTLGAAMAFGAEVRETEGRWEITGTGGKLSDPGRTLDLGNSGTGLRMLTGLAATCDFPVHFDGDASLRTRLMKGLFDALRPLGAEIDASRDKCPFTIRGAIRGGSTRVDGTTSQFLTSLLFTLPTVEGDSVVDLDFLHEKPYVGITLNWLESFNIRCRHSDDLLHWEIPGGQRFPTFERVIPADFSTAAFPLVAAALAGDGVTIRNLDFDDVQGDKAVFPLLEEMGARLEHGAELRVSPAGVLHGRELDLNATPDALPVLAAAGALADGVTRLVNVPQARVKETDRIAVMNSELTRMGAEIEELPDGMVIRGSRLHGARVSSHGDHRIAMALAVAALAADGVTEIDGAEAASVTYPDFVRDFQKLGADFTLVP